MYMKKIIITFLSITSIIIAQNRGNNLSFQGIDNFNNQGVKAAAMAGAYTSQSGMVDALHYNPAGLSGITSIQISAATNFSNNKWFENQVYRPNRYFVTLPFYLERLYTPDPAQNGMFDHERLWTEDFLIDSNYVVNFPETGLDPQSEDAANWIKKNDNSGLSSIMAAMPFSISNQKFVAAISYGREVTFADYDRNETFLDPHIGYDSYGQISRVNGNDTLVVNWFDYARERTGEIDNINAAISYELNENFSFGLGAKISWGQSDDRQTLDKIGYFDLVQQNRFRFSYDTTYHYISGKSDYSSTAFNVGILFQLDKFSVGLKVDLPYTFTREYSYEEQFMDSTGSFSRSFSGADEAKFPMVYTAGISFSPVNNITLAIDYQYAPYSETEFEFSSADTTFNNWVDQEVFRFGLDYKAFEFLSLQAGYKQVPQTFVPDGAAIKDSGPKAESINAGIGVHTDYGSIHLAYEYRVLRYYDSYYSNTNYNTTQFSNLMIGYNLTL